MERKLWYNKPPNGWLEGLPIGNGQLAAMVYGEAGCDILSLNHEWLWRGKNRDRDNTPVPRERLNEIRRLLTGGDFFRATVLANICFGGLGGASGIERSLDPYQPAGDLIFEFDGIHEYEGRELDMDTGVAAARRRGVQSLFFVSGEANNIVCRWTAEQPVNGVLSFTREPDDCAEDWQVDGGVITYRCTINGGISFAVRITAATDGAIALRDKGLAISNATEVTAFVNIAVDIGDGLKEFNDFLTPDYKEYGGIYRAHCEEFFTAMNAFDLNIEAIDVPLPTDERIRRIKSGEEDTALHMLYFHYGRYLLLSSSIRGALPANLQGKWNRELFPPWYCDYTCNINLEMNYWLAEPCGMGECAEALLKFIERLVPHGKKAAMDLYGARGVYLPLKADAWGISTPASFGCAVWIGAAPWFARHFWEHWRYGGDLAFLKNRAYPFFKEVAQFFEDYLVRDGAGVWQIMPSQSPENRFVASGSLPLISIGISSAMDVQLVFDALGYAIQSAGILCIDGDSVVVWREMRDNLPEFKIGSDGRLLEWDREMDEPEPGHRHLSHLYGLFPSDLFNPEQSEPQYNAAIKALQHRMAVGGGHTGWSRAWAACLFARAGRGGELYQHLNALIADYATSSLLDLHPPGIFQIDGNLGAAAAVIESIAQFWAGKLHILRALPKEYGTGRITGLKVPGGHTVSFGWKDGRAVEGEAVVGYSGELIIRAERDIVVKGNAGERVAIGF
jgi:alpha-L-fucosidase 2